MKLLFAVNSVGAFGDGLYAYLLPVFLTENLGASPEEVGILYAAMSLCAALTLLVAGILADKYDRKKIMIVGWLAWVPAPLIFSFARNWLDALPGMMLWGVWLGGPTVTAYVVATADKNRLTLTFTTISAAWSLGYIFSPALGGYLGGIFGMQLVFLLASFFYSVSCFLLIFVRSQHAATSAQKPSQVHSSFFKLIRTRALLKLSGFFAAIMFVMMMFRPFIPQFLAKVYGFDRFEIGVLGSVCFLGSAVLGIIIGRFGDRTKKSNAIVASLILSSASVILLALSNNFIVLSVTLFLAGGSYMAWSLLSAVVGPLAPENIRARWISIPQTVSMFSSFIAPYVGGILFDASPYYLLIAAAAASCIMALLAATALGD
ncbi:MFS transporter [Candidatus Bathyarchaeota archaeon]|nr:MFS transporter [Candidatus Bathyarchaeota archaeon]